MLMLTLSQTLSYYKRRDVQSLILEFAKDKEIGVRFNESFGKRPDVLNYEIDILELAKKGATSFHCSEELWNNPLQLNPAMRKPEIEELRKGWDLIFDIDCPFWALSKLTAYLFIKALKDHKIECVTVKFSGGKGFHIAVPFEAFPDKKYYIDEQYRDVRNLFPEGPRKIAAYLVNYINDVLIKVDSEKITFGKVSVSIQKIESDTGKSRKELTRTVCTNCKKTITEDNIKKSNIQEYICPNCDNRIEDVDKPYVLCPKCKKLMEKQKSTKTLCSCGSNKTFSEFDLSSIVAVDTVLISSRHLYRMPYSLHEKTGLVSMPFDIKHILKFEKEEADVTRFKPYKFLDRTETKQSEAEMLFQKAFDSQTEQKKRESEKIKKDFDKAKKESTYQNVEANQVAIPEEFFPPCIKKISRGLEDGKKRALFILINFLSSVNWEYNKLEEYIIKWNERNKPDQLRETYVRGQLRYYKSQKEKLPPPNCDNKGYMVDTGFCNPDGLCPRIKNPAQYAKRKAYLMNLGGGTKNKRRENKAGKEEDNKTSKKLDDKNINHEKQE